MLTETEGRREGGDGRRAPSGRRDQLSLKTLKTNIKFAIHLLMHTAINHVHSCIWA